MLNCRRCVMVLVAVLGAGLLAGCGSLSHDIARDGSHAGQLVWPDAGDANALHPHGTFPNLANLRAVQRGLDKAQVMALIGPPQFGEGFFDVHEWNYVLNFRSDGKVIRCGYKVLFSDRMTVGSTYWQPAACADVLDPSSLRS